MTNDDVAIKVAEMDLQVKSYTRRIEKLEQKADVLNRLAASIEVMANEQKHQTEAILDIKNDVNALDGKVETLEHKPGKRWDSAVEKITLTVIATIVGFILARIGIG